MLQVFLFNINETLGHTTSLSESLNVELYNDILKMFNQAWEETLPALGNDLDEHVLENLFERQVKKSTLMKHAMTLHQRHIVLKKEPRSYQRLRLWSMTSSSSNSRTRRFLKRTIKRQSSISILFEWS